MFTQALEGYGRRLSRLDGGKLLCDGLIGLEKESLRVATDGTLSQRPHPEILGSPLTHPWLTTDYSEALLEFITPPRNEGTAALAFLDDLQTYVYSRLDEELLWATSMPCVVAGDSGIPIARYGTSNAGLMKHVYRVGLGYRYGKVMQVIAGTHFNYSLPDGLWPVLQEIEGAAAGGRAFVDDTYMAMMRNLQRFGWLVPYLFGASPAVCKSFFGGRPTDMPVFDEGTYFEPYATSLRMGDIGYQNQREESVGIKACYDDLESYIHGLTRAIETPAALWEAIGVKVDGEWRQLNANILQIENEYYSTIRPKQILEGFEKPTLALKRRGIRYVELRSPDVDAFHPLGIDATQIRFLETLMLFCLLTDSPRIGADEAREIDLNLQRTAHQGRKPGLHLVRGQQEVALRQWAAEILEAMSDLAAALDGEKGGRTYRSALAEQQEKVDDPALTPSARMLTEMRENGESFHQFAWRKSQEHRELFLSRAPDPAFSQQMDEEGRASRARQQAMEAGRGQSFDAFLDAYFAQK